MMVQPMVLFAGLSRFDPSHAKALSNLASLLRSNGAFSSAVDYARRAVRAGPDDPEAHNNLGNALKDSGGDWVEDAVASYRQALELAPDYALAHWNLSLALLSLGDYKEGFAEMAWRWQWTDFPARRQSKSKNSQALKVFLGSVCKKVILMRMHSLSPIIFRSATPTQSRLLKQRGLFRPLIWLAPAIPQWRIWRVRWGNRFGCYSTMRRIGVG
jgi:Tfp pilus assembly protein PilF